MFLLCDYVVQKESFVFLCARLREFHSSQKIPIIGIIQIDEGIV